MTAEPSRANERLTIPEFWQRRGRGRIAVALENRFGVPDPHVPEPFRVRVDEAAFSAIDLSVCPCDSRSGQKPKISLVGQFP